MKVIAAKEMARIEKLAYDRGASDARFMYAAGTGVGEVVQRFISMHHLDWQVLLLCGKGNNSGDAYVAGSSLLSHGFTVRALQLNPFEECSPLCRQRGEEFRQHGGDVIEVHHGSQLEFYASGVIIDGILGTGFRGEVKGLFADAIEAAQATNLPILAVDIPSGVDGNTGDVSAIAVRANATIFLGLPKTGFFLGDGWNQMGALHGVDFGLPATSVDEANADLLMVTEEEAKRRLPKVVRTRHKYQAGYVVGLAGSLEMPGAAALSGFAALRAGAGIVRILVPESVQSRLAGFPPELIAQPFPHGDTEAVLHALNESSACLIGPGLGKSAEASALLHVVLARLERPTVLDADGLNLLSQGQDWKLPSQTVLTPHWGEMRRLLGLANQEQPSGLEWLKVCQAYAKRHNVVVVLKGSPTFVLDPKTSTPWVIPRGDPGMATAGCGDVLTGVIAANLAQGLSPLDAALLGVYIHALAGEAAAAELTSYSVAATDVTNHLPAAYSTILE